MIEEDAQTRAGTPRLTFAYISLFHLVSTLEGVSESVNRHYLDGPLEPLPSNMVEDSDEPLESARIRFRDTHFDVFHADPDDHIFRTLRSSKGFYEVDFLSAISRFLTKDDFVLDVGANIACNSL